MIGVFYRVMAAGHRARCVEFISAIGAPSVLTSPQYCSIAEGRLQGKRRNVGVVGRGDGIRRGLAEAVLMEFHAAIAGS